LDKAELKDFPCRLSDGYLLALIICEALEKAPARIVIAGKAIGICQAGHGFPLVALFGIQLAEISPGA
jgi:hypothetical protein